MRGLSSKDAQELLKKYGRNELPPARKKHIILRFFSQLANPLVALLFVAASFSLLAGELLNASLILSIVFLNALFGIYQERKADEAVDLLKVASVQKVRVIRDGKEQELESAVIVPGDIVYVEEGQKIAADGKILNTHYIEINESALTGESMPVPKENGDPARMGTIVARGRGYVKITKTGINTEFGSIAATLIHIEKSKSPLQRKLEQISRVIGFLGIGVAVLIFYLSSVQGAGLYLSFLLAVSLAVALVPEGLPAVMTMTLGIGVREMAKKRAIVKNLSSIEALGNVTVIATDKTGTLTQNIMEVREVYTEAQNLLLLNAVLCSTASLVESYKNTFDVLGDPTEGALILHAEKNGLSCEKERKKWKLIDEVPFNSETKTMSVHVRKGKEEYIFTKGAFESIISRSSHIRINGRQERLTSIKKKHISDKVEHWAKRGFRIIASGFSESAKKDASLIFLGVFALYDPPRPEAAASLKKAEQAGIRVIMITGDNEKTAESIASHIGLLRWGDEIITGEQLDKYNDRELLSLLKKVKIFARITPHHKSKIVSLLKQQGEIVAVTGDGVNDTIALKEADVGVAMGKVGTDVARETADIVISDDNFATIVDAVEEGRHIVKRLKNSLIYLLTGNVSEAASLTAGLMFGLPYLFFPIQFLYINLLSDGIPALMLAFSPKTSDIMDSRQKNDKTLINPFDTIFIILISFSAASLVLFSYLLFKNQGGEFMGRTAAFSVIALLQTFIFIDMWFSHKSILRNFSKLASRMFFFGFLTPVIVQFIIVRSEFLSGLFRINTVSIQTYLAFIGMSSLILIAIGIVKKLFKNQSSVFNRQ